MSGTKRGLALTPEHGPNRIIVVKFPENEYKEQVRPDKEYPVVDGATDPKYARELLEKNPPRRREALQDMTPFLIITTGLKSYIQKVKHNSQGKKELLKSHIDTKFHKVEKNGIAEICLVIPFAFEDTPVRVVLDVEDNVEPKTEHDEQQEKVTDMLTRLEGQINYLTKSMENINNRAEYAKDFSIDFHKNTVKMNNDTLYWPMAQVTFLVVIGLMQARYLIRFFRTKHLH